MSRPLMQITGWVELQRKLKQIGDDKTKRAEAVKVLRRVAQPIARMAKQRAPVSDKPHTVSGKRTKKTIQPGNLGKSMGVIVARRSKNPQVVVGPRAKGNNDGWYGHFVEYGHNIYRPGFKRQHSASSKAKRHNASGAKAKTKAQPFMKQLLNETKGQVVPQAEKAVAKFIQQSINRLSR